MKLSIITINYNHKDGLKRTIDSIVAQTFKDYEWIVIDGGSTDGSKELIESYQSYFSYWCSEPDKGIYNALNKGIEHAQGEYLNFMNSGDIFASDTILNDVFSQPHKADIMYGYMVVGSLDGCIPNINIMKKRLTLYDFYFDTFGHQATFTKRGLFEKIGLFDESYRIIADRKFFAEAIVKNNASYELLPMKIAVFEGGGVSSGNIDDEISRFRAELYSPDNLEQASHLITYSKLIDEFSWSRSLYMLLVHMANWCYNHFRKHK